MLKVASELYQQVASRLIQVNTRVQGGIVAAPLFISADFILKPLTVLVLQFIMTITQAFWSLDSLLLMLAYMTRNLRVWMVSSFFGPILDMFMGPAGGEGVLLPIIRASFLLAVMALGISYIARAFFQVKLVNPQRLFMWGAVCILFLGTGAARSAYEGVEYFREMSAFLYNSVFIQFWDHPEEIARAFSDPAAAPPDVYPATDPGGVAPIIGYPDPAGPAHGYNVAGAFVRATMDDVLHPAIQVGPIGVTFPLPKHYDLVPGCEGTSFYAVFWNNMEPVELGNQDEPARSQAVGLASRGAMRMALGIVPGILALFESLIFLCLTLATGILFVTFPIALIFAFFEPTEPIATGMIKQYFQIFIRTITISALFAILKLLLMAGAYLGNGIVFLASTVLGCMFGVVFLKDSLKTVPDALKAFTQGLGQVTGMKGVGQIGQGAKKALGAVGAGAMAAVGGMGVAGAAGAMLGSNRGLYTVMSAGEAMGAFGQKPSANMTSFMRGMRISGMSGRNPFSPVAATQWFSLRQRKLADHVQDKYESEYTSLQSRLQQERQAFQAGQGPKPEFDQQYEDWQAGRRKEAPEELQNLTRLQQEYQTIQDRPFMGGIPPRTGGRLRPRRWRKDMDLASLAPGGRRRPGGGPGPAGGPGGTAAPGGCPKCGSPLQSGAQYCTNCGAQVGQPQPGGQPAAPGERVPMGPMDARAAEDAAAVGPRGGEVLGTIGNLDSGTVLDSLDQGMIVSPGANGVVEALPFDEADIPPEAFAAGADTMDPTALVEQGYTVGQAPDAPIYYYWQDEANVDPGLGGLGAQARSAMAGMRGAGRPRAAARAAPVRTAGAVQDVAGLPIGARGRPAAAQAAGAAAPSACPNCGNPVPGGSRYCPHCGRLTPPAETPAAPAAPVTGHHEAAPPPAAKKGPAPPPPVATAPAVAPDKSMNVPTGLADAIRSAFRESGTGAATRPLPDPAAMVPELLAAAGKTASSNPEAAGRLPDLVKGTMEMMGQAGVAQGDVARVVYDGSGAMRPAFASYVWDRAEQGLPATATEGEAVRAIGTSPAVDLELSITEAMGTTLNMADQLLFEAARAGYGGMLQGTADPVAAIAGRTSGPWQGAVDEGQTMSAYEPGVYQPSHQIGQVASALSDPAKSLSREEAIGILAETLGVSAGSVYDCLTRHDATEATSVVQTVEGLVQQMQKEGVPAEALLRSIYTDDGHDIRPEFISAVVARAHDGAASFMGSPQDIADLKTLIAAGLGGEKTVPDDAIVQAIAASIASPGAAGSGAADVAARLYMPDTAWANATSAVNGFAHVAGTFHLKPEEVAGILEARSGQMDAAQEDALRQRLISEGHLSPEGAQQALEQLRGLARNIPDTLRVPRSFQAGG